MNPENTCMKCNVGKADRLLRTGALMGTVVFAVLPGVPLRWRQLAAATAAMELFTVLSRYCPVNEVLGINTCSHRGHRASRRRSPGW